MHKEDIILYVYVYLAPAYTLCKQVRGVGVKMCCGACTNK